MSRAGTAVLAVAAAAALAGAGCTGDIDPPWQLDHNRIVAVRAEPPSIMAGQSSRIDALLAMKGARTSVATPELAAVVSPASMADVLSIDNGTWVVTAPSEDRIAAARSDLKLAVDAPVPLQIGVSYAGGALTAVKTIDLGATSANPTLSGLMINGQPAPDAGGAVAIGKLVRVPLSIDANDVQFDVNWVTSCGTMHDYDLPQSYMEVEAGDPTSGELGVVLRDSNGGVDWRIWPIQAQ